MGNPVIDTHGNKRWYDKYGQDHRLDGPAIEYYNGNKSWYINNRWVYSLSLQGQALKGELDMSDLPDTVKQSIIIEILKVKANG
jgi:hypothetical protein